MTWKIKAIAGPFVGQEILIDQDKIIGRDSKVDIVLQGGHISRRHAALFLQDEQLWIKDLNSSNGTLVNGARITEQQLHHNDNIQIDVVQFLVANTLQNMLSEPTPESIIQENTPDTISIFKPTTPLPQQSQVHSVQATAENTNIPTKGIKNTLPAAIGMAMLILLIILSVWYFIGH